MYKNGKVSFISEVSGGFSANGDKLGPAIIKTAFVPCNIEITDQRYSRTTNVQYIDRKMKILVDYAVAPTLDFVNIKSLEIINSTGTNLGIIPIQEVTLLTLVKRIKFEL